MKVFVVTTTRGEYSMTQWRIAATFANRAAAESYVADYYSACDEICRIVGRKPSRSTDTLQMRADWDVRAQREADDRRVAIDTLYDDLRERLEIHEDEVRS